jgi:hypothetical protein
MPQDCRISMHTKTHIRTLMHGYEHRHKQVYTRWNKKVRFATNQCPSFLDSHREENVQPMERSLRGDCERGGNGPGSKGKGEGWQKPVSVRLYTPITPYLLTLPQLNISYDGNCCATCGREVVLPHRLAARTAAMNTVTPRIPNTAIHSPRIPFRGPPLDNN